MPKHSTEPVIVVLHHKVHRGSNSQVLSYIVEVALHNEKYCCSCQIPQKQTPNSKKQCGPKQGEKDAFPIELTAPIGNKRPYITDTKMPNREGGCEEIVGFRIPEK